MTRTPLRRPRATLGALALGIAVGLTACALGGPRPLDTIGGVAFSTPLRIPPLLEPTVATDGTRSFELTAAAGESTIGAGAARSWGYNGPIGGPTLVLERGQNVAVTLHNELPEPTTLHWHGMHLPAAMDGGPHQLITPGSSRTPTWRVDQPAATLWYHPHPHGRTTDQVGMGLAGLVIVRDEAERSLGLPDDYGVDDIPVIVSDVSLDEAGRRVESEQGFVGPLGSTVLVNGTAGPVQRVVTEAVRLRIVNASAARIYDFGFADRRGFEQIASDGGLLAAPHETDHVRLAPGERAEIVARFVPGESATLQSTPPELGAGAVLAGANGGADRLDVVRFEAEPHLDARPPVPPALVAIEPIPASAVSRHRVFELDDHQINGRSMEAARIDAIVERGATEEWTVRNDMALPHDFHVHDVQFQVVSVGGSPPPPETAGWKDTIYLEPETDYVLRMTFAGDSDRVNPYMIHCHLLQHEDLGMMAQFLVVEPGMAADSVEPEANEGHTHD
ncbi:multicopper oxidase domain-containing protein [Microbacteriaceae bacterium VKM Ac-2854]|nr:multicopper oxidase domain-containing protein [Microbacteriaceae bacterium VKM Ac-2854]